MRDLPPIRTAGQHFTSLPLGNPAPWMDDALCREVDPELFFPDHGHVEQAREAQRVCRACPVSLECALAATEERWGIWAGTTERQRRTARARRRKKAA